MTRRLMVAVATFAAVSLVASACSTSSSDDAQAGAETTAGPSAASASTAPQPDTTTTVAPSERQAEPTVGVTDDSVTLVVMSVAADSVSGQGINTETDITVEQALDALLGPINETGGIAGRTIDAQVVEFGIDVDAQRAACIEATEDRGAFVAINTQGIFGDPVLCLVEQHHTIFLEGDGFTPDFYDRAEGRLFSTVPSKHRAMAVAADYASDLGLLDGATVGIVGTGDISGAQAVDEGLVPALAEHGVDPASIARLSSDIDEMTPQVPPAVEAMRSAGVDTVFLMHNVLANSQFVSEAAAIGWEPQWIASDAAQGVSDLAISLMPAEPYDGAVGVTSTLAGALDAGEQEPEANVACRERIEKGTGVTLTRVDDEGNEPPAYATWMILCNLVDSFVTGLEGAGTELDQTSFIETLESVRDIPLANQGGSGSFTATKHDAPDSFRAVRYDAQCDCWVPEGDFVPVS